MIKIVYNQLSQFQKESAEFKVAFAYWESYVEKFNLLHKLEEEKKTEKKVNPKEERNSKKSGNVDGDLMSDIGIKESKGIFPKMNSIESTYIIPILIISFQF